MDAKTRRIVESWPTEEEMRKDIVDYPTGFRLILPRERFATADEYYDQFKNGPWVKPPADAGAHVHDLATERKKRQKGHADVH